jgi:hypothetical protein
MAPTRAPDVVKMELERLISLSGYCILGMGLLMLTDLTFVVYYAILDTGTACAYGLVALFAVMRWCVLYDPDGRHDFGTEAGIDTVFLFPFAFGLWDIMSTSHASWDSAEVRHTILYAAVLSVLAMLGCIGVRACVVMCEWNCIQGSMLRRFPRIPGVFSGTTNLPVPVVMSNPAA